MNLGPQRALGDAAAEPLGSFAETEEFRERHDPGLANLDPVDLHDPSFEVVCRHSLAGLMAMMPTEGRA